jgi:ribosome biogenesis GTPase A
MSDVIKQDVQWFPGHMAKTRRLIKEDLRLVDATVEMVDARIPASSRNPEIDEIVSGKPHIIILNKADTADAQVTKAWCSHFEKAGIAVLAADCRSGRGLDAFAPLCRKILAQKIELNNKRGMPGKTLRLMVVGIPNTGKSTFINKMAGSGKTKTEDRPGVTVRTQWVVCRDGIELLDTPGVLWPKFDDPKVGDRLAFTGGVKDAVTDPETVAVRLIGLLCSEYPDALIKRYSLTTEDTSSEPFDVLCLIAKKRGMLSRGAQPDTLRAAQTLLDEYRGGKLGAMSFEYPPEYNKRS